MLGVVQIHFFVNIEIFGLDINCHLTKVDKKLKRSQKAFPKTWFIAMFSHEM